MIVIGCTILSLCVLVLAAAIVVWTIHDAIVGVLEWLE